MRLREAEEDAMFSRIAAAAQTDRADSITLEDQRQDAPRSVFPIAFGVRRPWTCPRLERTTP
jgi:hypothetical protein